MDVDAIPLGADFVQVLGDEVGKCDVLLAIIGPAWLDARDEEGNRRLDNANDFVRIEIASALKRNIRVIPLLLEGTRVPKAEQLPDVLKALALRNGLDVRHASFQADLDKLIRGLNPVEPGLGATAAPAVDDRHLFEGRIQINAKIVHGAADGSFMPGAGKTEWFKDLDSGPEMVVVPAGLFMMGADDDLERADLIAGSEHPQHQVTITRPFAVGRYAITRGEFAEFVKQTGFTPQENTLVWVDKSGWEIDPAAAWNSPGFHQDNSHPVVCISWEDANAYTNWLEHITGSPYRLLTEAEREYITRAGTTTSFWWGASIQSAQANYNGSLEYWVGDKPGEYRKSTVPASSFLPNPWGIYNVHGNVMEWCQDVWHDDYVGAPSNGNAWLAEGERDRRVVRGGSWNASPTFVRSAARVRFHLRSARNSVGFRVARTI